MERIATKCKFKFLQNMQNNSETRQVDHTAEIPKTATAGGGTAKPESETAASSKLGAELIAADVLEPFHWKRPSKNNTSLEDLKIYTPY